MKNKYWLGLLIIFTISVATAGTITIISPMNLAAVNYTFTDDRSNASTTFDVSKFITIQNATMNVSGFENTTFYLISGAESGEFNGSVWLGSTWNRSRFIASGLGGAGTYNSPATFIIDDTYYLITGNLNGELTNGFNWTGSTWLSYNAIATGLGSIGTWSRPTIFNISGTTFLIAGNQEGKFYGFNWTGATWQEDFKINSSLGDIGADSAPEVFNMSNTLYLISGASNGKFYGFNWTGATWQEDFKINSSLGDIGIYSTPSVFEKDGTWFLISGNQEGKFYGFNWTGATWQEDFKINSSLGDIGFYSTPDVFSIDIFPTNVSIDIENDKDSEFFEPKLSNTNSPQLFNYTNFTNSLNNYIDNTCTGSTCQIPINISTDTVGVVQLDAITLFFNPSNLYSESFPGNTFESAIDKFNATVTFITGENPFLNLWYNGTLFLATQTEINTNNASYELELEIPLIVGSASQVNRTFYWNITDSVGSYNATKHSHNVSAIDLVNCTGDEIVALNFSLFNEFVPHSPITGDMDATFDIKVGDSSSIRQINFSWTNQPFFEVCLGNNKSTLRIDSFQEYTASGFSIRNYFLSNGSINNITSNISLYLLASENSTDILIQVTDDDGITGLEGIIGRVQRYFIGQNAFLTVAMLRTDVDGNFEVPLDLKGWYRFVLEQDNEVEVITNPAQLLSTSLVFKIGDTLSYYLNRYRTLQGLNFLLDFNNATNITTFFFNDPSSIPRTGCLKVVKENFAGRTTLSSNCQHLSSATISYDLSGQEEDQYFAIASVIDNQGNRFVLDELEISFLSGVPIFGAEGVFMTALVVGTVALMAVFSAVAAVVLSVVALGFMAMAGFIAIQTSVLIGLIILAAIIVYLTMRR